MANKKDPPNNKLAAALTAGISSALVWNQNRMVNKDARLLQTSQKTLHPNNETLSFDQAKDNVTLYRESKSGRRKLRGLRASGQLQDIGDWRKGKRTARKTARMKKRYGEMKGGGIVFTRTTRRHGS